LGCILTYNLSDADDISRQTRYIYASSNSLIRQFYMCSVDVKIALFKTYCQSLYCSHLWFHYKKSELNGFHVAYHKSLKRLFNVPVYERNRFICSFLNISSAQALRRNFLFKFILRITSVATNHFLPSSFSSFYSSCLVKHLFESLRT
jgi:hypothetical protein